MSVAPNRRVTIQCGNACGDAVYSMPVPVMRAMLPPFEVFPVSPRAIDDVRIGRFAGHSQLSVLAPESYPCASSQRSASMAAAQPVPAAVTACL
jgi:hypothetical protein